MKLKRRLAPVPGCKTAPVVGKVSWTAMLARRAATLRFVKILGTTLGIAGFFPLYFWVSENASARALVMPLTSPDNWIVLREASLPLYASLWLLVSLPAAFSKDAAELHRYGASAAVMVAAGLALFWLVPTRTPAFDVDWSQYQLLAFLKNSDVAGNACPSLHVSFSLLACSALSRQLREVAAPIWIRGLNWLWGAGVVYSTVATRQHVALDVLGGLLLGATVIAGLRMLPVEPGFLRRANAGSMPRRFQTDPLFERPHRVAGDGRRRTRA